VYESPGMAAECTPESGSDSSAKSVDMKCAQYPFSSRRRHPAD